MENIHPTNNDTNWVHKGKTQAVSKRHLEMKKGERTMWKEHVHVHDTAFQQHRTNNRPCAHVWGGFFSRVYEFHCRAVFMPVIDCSMIARVCVYVCVRVCACACEFVYWISSEEENAVRSEEKWKHAPIHAHTMFWKKSTMCGEWNMENRKSATISKRKCRLSLLYVDKMEKPAFVCQTNTVALHERNIY